MSYNLDMQEMEYWGLVLTCDSWYYTDDIIGETSDVLGKWEFF